MLDLHDVSASYPGAGAVLRDVTVRVQPGGTECVIGPSGCGKTTLLMVAAGLKEADSGSVQLDGTPIRPGDRRVSLIQQQYGLFPWFTVKENAGMALRIQGVGRTEREKAMRLLLERVGLAARERSYPSELSGGEQQRVAIARGLSVSPELLLMDEPFSALDAISRESLQDLLSGLLRERGLAAVMVTHSIEEAAFLGSSISLLAGSPATIVERFENPGRGSRGFRSSGEYFSLEKEIRSAMFRHRIAPNE
jgi:ABC-type nitrate/sulfonate/bicarbonate transport system ATPase subunit